MKNKGLTFLDVVGTDLWKGTKRPRGWRGELFGLVMHTTGAGLPIRATDAGEDIFDRAKKHYLRSHGTHYVISYEGNLSQVANEVMQANGVGMQAQINAVNSGEWLDRSFTSDYARNKWLTVRNDYEDPTKLFPTKYVNSCYGHVEMPPCVFWFHGTLMTVAEPLEEGLRFTKAQHDKVADLAIDMAERNRWPDGWWLTGRLSGHEELSPISRGTSSGCWDPGFLREKVWFDKGYVIKRIEKHYKKLEEATRQLEQAESIVLADKQAVGPYENFLNTCKEWLFSIFKKGK